MQLGDRRQIHSRAALNVVEPLSTNLLAIRAPSDDGGDGVVGDRTEYIGVDGDPVAECYGDVALEDDVTWKWKRALTAYGACFQSQALLFESRVAGAGRIGRKKAAKESRVRIVAGDAQGAFYDFAFCSVLSVGASTERSSQ